MKMRQFYKVKIKDHLYDVEIVDPSARPVLAVVDGTPIEVWPETDLAQAGKTQTQATGAASASSSTLQAENSLVKSILAPMPGVISSVAIKAGAQVAYGEEICTLEAMKMKNLIRSPRAGTISQVLVNAGQSVKHHDVLVEYQD